MSTSNILQKAQAVDVREAQAQLSKLIHSKTLSMILFDGKPVSVLVPYEDLVDLVEILDELTDNKLLGEIKRARKEYAKGITVPADHFLNIPLQRNVPCR